MEITTRVSTVGVGSPGASPGSIAANPLAGKKLRYKIGADHPGMGNAGEIVEVGYDWNAPLPAGISIAYGNLFNEKYSEQNEQERAEYGSYLKNSDTVAI
jgi:hypothetical protein